jgi:hypothetical protein
METKARLDKAINGLSKILGRHSDFKNIKIENDTILIDNNKPELFGTILYLAVVLLIPAGLLLYEIVTKKDFYFSLFLLPVFLFLFGRDLFKMIRGDTVLLINLKDKFIVVENINKVFSRYYPKRKILFTDILKVELIEKAVHSKYRATRWTELTMVDTNNEKYILTNFSNKYPESMIAQKVKFLFDVLIWTEKKSSI